MNSKSESPKIDRRSFLGGTAAGALLGSAQAWAGTGKSGSAGPVVETKAGKLRGVALEKCVAFKGVSYGASTAGAGRFQPPRKLEPWSGVKDALELGARSPQNPSGLIPEVDAVDRKEPMSEDCLHLNVWTPSLGSGHKRPVMFWLHGGGFTSGSGGFAIYDGTNLAARHDVVVVTVNHRLNVFGYLYLAGIGGAKYADASNVGMLDIIQALEWVRDNIAGFGGDPNNVTIFGQSGGGAKVSTLLAMPAAQGLFHRAVIESGASLRGVPVEAANKSTEAVLAKLGIKTNQLDELQNMPREQLLHGISGGGLMGNAAFRFSPVVDGKTLTANPFDPTAPEMSAGVPLLIGSTQTEVTFFPGQLLDPIDEATMRQRVKQTLRAGDAETGKVIAAYKQVDPRISNIDLYLEVASDSFAMTNAVTAAERKAALGKAPVFMYYFKWRSPVRDGKLKAMHCMEIPFVFDNVDGGKPMTGSGQDRYALASKISGAWVAFARSGNPSQKGLHWPAYDASKRATMILDDQCEVVDDPRRDVRLALESVRRA
ncbi:MAG TPA: carboxylesterase/lipase family protein [Bryobacteraceae bacterium]|nr:carboxylesterase/lipase family protein [Bryobacteraceae bacterium]